MTASLHKLTAGTGYDYLTRQVAAMDATEKGHASLASYYTEKGEVPGRWVGAGLQALEVELGSAVSAVQIDKYDAYGMSTHEGEFLYFPEEAADHIAAELAARGHTVTRSNRYFF